MTSDWRLHHYLHWVGLCSSLVFWIFIRLHHVLCILPLHIQTFVEAKTCAWRKKCLKRDLYISKEVKPKHFCSNETSVQLCKKQTWVCWGLIGPPVTQRHACFPLLLLLLCICNSRRCCSPHFLNSLKNKTAITISALTLFPSFFGEHVFTFQEAMPGSGGPGMGPSHVIIIGQRRHAENWLWLTAGLYTNIKQPQQYVLYTIYSLTLSQGLKWTVNKITAPWGR